MWPWTLTSWTPKLNVSCPCPVDHVCQFASKLVHSFSKYHVHEFVNGKTDRWTDGQVESIMPPASLECRHKICQKYCNVAALNNYSYLHDLISLQPLRSTRSSSVVTLSRPPTTFSLKITDRSFRYASPRLWNQLPDSFHQPHHSRLDSPPHPLLNSSLSSSPLSSSITPSLFHSRLKTYYFNKSFPP